jgi:hypothetical protein
MFSINLKVEVYWSFLLIFDTISHKTNRSDQKRMQNKTDGQKRSSIFWVAKSASFFEWQKGISPFFFAINFVGNLAVPVLAELIMLWWLVGKKIWETV